MNRSCLPLKSLLSALPIFFTADVLANAWLLQSPTLGAKSAITDYNAQLVSEELNVQLFEKNYRAEVVYRIRDGKYFPFQGNMIFPVICTEPSPMHEIGEVRGDCIESFEVSVDGEAVVASSESIRDIGPLLQGYENMVAGFEAAVKDQPDESIISRNVYPSTVLNLRKFPVGNSEKKLREIRILYRSPYFSYTGGWSNSSFQNFSRKIFFYDFSPAATWSPGKLESFHINIDASAISDNIEFPEEFEFSEKDGVFSLAQKQMDIAEVPPLILSIDSAKRKQYQYHREALAYPPKLEWTLKAGSQLPDYPVDLARDGDPKTAWCTDKLPAVVSVEIAAKANRCYLEGVALMNGYNKSETIYRANRRAKSGTVRVTGVTTRTTRPEHYKGEGRFELPETLPRESWNPLDSIRYLVGDGHGVPTDQSGALSGGLERKHKLPFMGTGLSYELEIKEAYSGDKYPDMCISEIYPVLNCI